MVASTNKFILAKHGITHVLTVGSGLQPRHPQQFKYLWIQELDSPTANLKRHFDRMTDFIDSVIAENGKVLVHCYAGVSRSATTVI